MAEPLIRLRSEPPPVEQLHRLWLAVSRAGGAVNFLTDSPESEIRTAAEAAVAEVRSGELALLTLDDGPALVGTVFLRPGTGPRMTHRADVVRLMVDPGLQGRGWGGALLDAAAAHARRLGLRQLRLSTRGGTALPAFYAARGWTEVGVFPDALQLHPGEFRDEHWFQLAL
ncbi:GNAT family N-acetyltransferase [Pseudonocardia broussonetiae]|uniref:GNAT family N-acetyltransferase n=1 Tax=Pseudonocardia broussonetiae TaxID=2736640 RepID=A0A6M6JKI4_9PSEU|nr:GNAT family N-acetyltransferase [Pseudonocardia broussonetiae]QJY47152.1 GNAT family N-acetyltransferase [Pseudonocardia broussonetiae]